MARASSKDGQLRRYALAPMGDGVPAEQATAGLAALSVDEAVGVSPPPSPRRS
jgi:hypothetical protein